MEQKNIAEGSFKEIIIEHGFSILKVQNESSEIQRFSKKIDRSYLQFHFCTKGGAKFVFNQGNYALDLPAEQSLLLYNTQIDLPLNCELQPNSWMLSLVMSIQKFHSLFSLQAEYIPFLSEDFKDKKYYTQELITPPIAVVLSQLMNYNLHPNITDLYLKGKVYELIALYFNRVDNTAAEQCPFLVDEENVKRIRRAKEIILERMAEPPTLQALSDEIGLSLKKLKQGFKQIYGDTVYSFLFEHKMEMARKMLETNQYNVNEVGLKVGYSTSSHFIAAFKKKYGTTPKKYLMAQGQ
ncbi:MAG: helix-turn-helix transcriptional regulator [Flavobacteriaceae bacterium]|nr:AraC family transcriptional regulator [Muriicola sp.]MBT8289458.1 AraC family transcriptional regulator [Muriicola sp.]NNK34650.1 helix-turn-helix transcriptional regulator [Eudoraea sp.]NNL40029.1 helix-turn-helix transcriptional regulator [Flavobacteriaceae bacterium]